MRCSPGAADGAARAGDLKRWPSDIELEQTAFLYGGNAAFLADLYARWVRDPSSVDPSWRGYFDELGPKTRALFERAAAALRPRAAEPPQAAPAAARRQAAPVADLGSERSRRADVDHLRALMLIRAYRVRGHLQAHLDPLGLAGDKHHPELDPATYGFTEADRDRPIFINNVLGLETATLARSWRSCAPTYCGPIGVEFMHIQEPDQKAWIQERMEGSPPGRGRPPRPSRRS